MDPVWTPCNATMDCKYDWTMRKCVDEEKKECLNKTGVHLVAKVKIHGEAKDSIL